MNPLRTIARFVRRVFARYEAVVYKFGRPRIQQGLTSARYDINSFTREEFVRLMRYQEANNPVVSALCGKFENFVVGANPQVMPASSDPDWNARAKVRWDQWCRFCDVGSRQSLATAMSLEAREWFSIGEGFILLTEGKEITKDGRTVRRPRIQLVEGQLCKTPPQFKDDPFVIDGIRVEPDANGKPSTRPLGYYFADEHKSGELTFGPMRDAKFVIHIFEPNRPGQMRGLTFFHSVYNELEELLVLHKLEMAAAAANSERVYEIQTQTGEVSLPGMIRSRGTTNVTTSTGASVSETADSYYKEALPTGRVVVTRKGDVINQHAGERPSVVTRDYWKYKTELVCAGVEVPYCIVFPDSMQGTVYRGALDMATSFFRSRHTVIADALRRIFEYVIGFEIRVEASVADAPDDWWNVSILPPRAPNVDVGRNATAEQQALLDGRTNYDLIYGPQGLSWREELKKLDEQKAFIQSECPTLAKELQEQRGGATPTAPATVTEDPIVALKASIDAYGVAVRAGAITPSVVDEDHFRQLLGLPTTTPDAKAAWSEEDNVRRPITLTQPGGDEPSQPIPIRGTEEDED